MSIQEQHRAVLARKNPSLAQIIASLGGSALWLDASSFSQSDDTDVTTWSDISGNARHALHTGANGEIAPSFRTNIQNGLPAIQWKGVSGCGLRIAAQDLAAGWGVGADITCYHAFKRPSANAGAFYTWDASGSGTNQLWFTPWHNAGSVFQYGGVADTDYAVITLVAMPIVTTWQIWCAHSSGTTITVFDKDNSQLFTGTGISPGLITGTDEFTVGSFGTTWGVGECYIGHMGEIIIFPGDHTLTQRASVLNALRAKWGI